jgi:pyrophosphate--fructose-6-phosphate 1-phosphotransferase
MPTEETLLGRLRRDFKPRLPEVLTSLDSLKISFGEATESTANQREISEMFPITYGAPMMDIAPRTDADDAKTASDFPPLKVGVVLSGGQASGGHNVIVGLFDAIKELNPESTLIGFLEGPIGVMKNKFIALEKEFVDKYRNTGGFDMIASGRDKIETEEQQRSALNTVTENDLDGLMVIGGDDSNTNAAVLAEYFAANKSKCVVIGVPKTIDGDLQNEFIEMSFGFDTAVKTYSEMIANICRDSMSAKKAWHFVKLMGRDASHVTLDCALQTQVNMALIGEEIEKENMLLHDITEHLCDMIVERAAAGRNYGVVLIPEGVISFIPSMKALIHDLTELLKKGSPHLAAVEAFDELSEKIKYVREELGKLSRTNLRNFDVLPRDIQAQLLLERDPHGNVQMSQIPIEQLFIQVCDKQLSTRRDYKGKFRGLGHFFGYDGRSGYPSNFDAQYCNALGRVGAVLINQKANGYMTRVYNLELDVTEWKAGAIPITMLMNMEVRHGSAKPVIKKCLVDVESGPKFHYYEKRRALWQIEDSYRFVGPIQFFGPTEVTDVPPINVLIKKTGDTVWPLPEAKSDDKK